MGGEKESTFKVSDRRLFNPDGTSRFDIDETEEPSLPINKITATVAPTPGGGLDSIPTTQAPAPMPELDDPYGISTGTVTFNDFVMSLAGNAMMCLGLVKQFGPMEPDLPSAQHMIEVLMVLKQKTHNNLSEEERQTLDDVLKNLQVQFVRLSQQLP